MYSEDYYDKIVEICKWFEKHKDSDRNEASTRFHLIDRILFECLGWSKDDCKPEETFEGKFTDYTFNNPGRVLIVEAKREGIYFELPVGYEKLECRIATLTKGNSEIKAAISQAMGYCQSRGVQFGAVSNGYQMIAFLASRNDGVPPMEGNAIVFDSIDRMKEHFLELWKYLSKDGIKNRELFAKLIGREAIVLPNKLSSTISVYPGSRSRNILQTDLQIVGELVLEGVVNNPEIEEDFIRDTYCTSGALSQYALVSKSILENRYSLLFDETHGGPTVKEAMTKKGVSSEMFAESLSSRPILLLGDVGSGKSMFIKYLKRLAAPKVFANAITVYIDLGTKAALAADLKQFVISEIKRLLYEQYQVDVDERNFVRGVYHGELQRFAKGIYSDLMEVNPGEFKKKEIEFLMEKLSQPENHLREAFNHISRGWKKQIIIFIDNVDQRDDEIQEHAFLIANEIAQNWPSTVFITLRPSTFHKSKKIGALTGYHPKAFTIAPPRVDEVLIKRLYFALKIASGELVSSKLSANIYINLVTLKQYLEILVHSLQHNHQLVEFIENISAGNVRTANEFLTTFIGSGHVDTKKILDQDNVHLSHGKRYTVSYHEFLRAIIYKDNAYYYPDATQIVNVFDLSQVDFREHFLMPIILDFFFRYSNKSENEGFITTSSLVKYLMDLGFNSDQIEHAIIRALSKDLIESEGRKKPSVGDPHPLHLRITTVGAYHITKLVKSFVYIDAILIDVPILDDDFRREIQDVEKIAERLMRAEKFCDYLDKAWDSTSTPTSGFNWVEASAAIRMDIEQVKSKIAPRP
jgi:hypothetical protein